MKFKKGNRWKSSKSELKYRTWRNMVFELNKRRHGLSRSYKCTKCGKTRKTTRVFHAHHIFSWDKYPKLRYDKSNGVVMCEWCHKKFHKKYSFKALDNPSLLVEYMSDKKIKDKIQEYVNDKGKQNED